MRLRHSQPGLRRLLTQNALREAAGRNIIEPMTPPATLSQLIASVAIDQQNLATASVTIANDTNAVQTNQAAVATAQTALTAAQTGLTAAQTQLQTDTTALLPDAQQLQTDVNALVTLLQAAAAPMTTGGTTA